MIRPATEADAETATALIVAADIKELGEADYTLADLRQEWSELDLARDAVIAEDDDGSPVGCAHFRGTEALAVVDPRREGEGAGTLLHEWIVRRAREIAPRAFEPELTRVAPAGFALVRTLEHRVAYVSVLAVHPDAQGQGLGAKLLQGVFAAAGRAGYGQLRLSVASDNPNALRLYERVGMTQRWRIDAFERPLPD